MFRREKSHRGIFIRHTITGQFQTVRRDFVRLQIIAGPIVLRDDIATSFDERKQVGQMCSQIGADVERADADDHGVKIFQPIRRQIRAGEQ